MRHKGDGPHSENYTVLLFTPDKSPHPMITDEFADGKPRENVLDRIMATKAREVAEAKARRPLADLERALADAPPTRSLRRAIAATPGGIISEFKRRSPSKGDIHAGAHVADVLPAYEQHGAAAASVLTDGPYFGGSLADLTEARRCCTLPLLRKEFVLDRYQLAEARVVGADAVLLIAAAIGAKRCHTLAREAHDMGLEVLLEIHRREELEAWSPCVDLIGVNNRDLTAFRTDPEQSVRLFPHLPGESLPISESGLLDPAWAARLAQCGYRGFLVGEAFMRTANPGQAIARYLKAMHDAQGQPCTD